MPTKADAPAVQSVTGWNRSCSLCTVAIVTGPFKELNGVPEIGNGCGAEIHIDVNQHSVFDEDWVTELTQPEGETHRFAVFPLVDCEDGG